MVAAENFALNNEFAPNNEVLRISSHHSDIRGIRVNASVNVEETSQYIVARVAEHSLESVVRGHHVYKYIWTHCLGEQLSLRADMANAPDLYCTMLCG